MSKKTRKISFLTKSLVGLFTITSAAAIPMAFANGTTVSTYNYSKELKADQNTTSNIKIKSLNDSNITEEQKSKIRTLYKQRPSDVSSSESKSNNSGSSEIQLSPTSIFNILEFNEDEVYGLSNETVSQNQAPVVTNLSNIASGRAFKWKAGTSGGESNGWVDYEATAPDDGLTKPTDPIPYLTREVTGEGANTDVTQEELNELGYLFLRVDMKRKADESAVTEFVMLSGFNSILNRKFLSSNIDLPGAEYKKNVGQISETDLLSYPSFKGVQPSSSVVTARTNNSQEGTLDYVVTYSYDIDKTIKLTKENGEEVVKKNTTDESISNITYNALTYDQEFLLTGFTRSPNISTEQIVEILAIIIAIGVAIAFLIYIGSLVTRKIRFAKKM